MNVLGYLIKFGSSKIHFVYFWLLVMRYMLKLIFLFPWCVPSIKRHEIRLERDLKFNYMKKSASMNYALC